MREEQNNFAYDNMENGSNQSLGPDEGGNSGLLGNINMGNLVQNPGRDSVNSQRKSERRTANIFAQKVRKTGRDSTEKSPHIHSSPGDHDSF